jgi:hypothetical protein
MTQPPQPPQFTEEEIRQIEEEMDRLRVEDVLLQTLVTLINLGARKAGLATPPDQEATGRDLEQTKLAIDGARALMPLVESAGAELAPIREAIARLQMAYVQLTGGTPQEAAPAAAPEAPKKDGPGPAQSSGRLWIPGQ